MAVDNIVEQCVFKPIFETQLVKELEQYNTDEGVIGFRDTGCDKCDGYNTVCPKYWIN